METLKGTVSTIRMIKFSKTPLLFFKLDTTNCLIAKHSLNFLADVDEKMKITVFGEFNYKKQFIVKKYTISGKSSIALIYERLADQNKVS